VLAHGEDNQTGVIVMLGSVCASEREPVSLIVSTEGSKTIVPGEMSSSPRPRDHEESFCEDFTLALTANADGR
jgi:hypothetical protein